MELLADSPLDRKRRKSLIERHGQMNVCLGDDPLCVHDSQKSCGVNSHLNALDQHRTPEPLTMLEKPPEGFLQCSALVSRNTITNLSQKTPISTHSNLRSPVASLGNFDSRSQWFADGKEQDPSYRPGRRFCYALQKMTLVATLEPPGQECRNGSIAWHHLGLDSWI